MKETISLLHSIVERAVPQAGEIEVIDSGLA